MSDALKRAVRTALQAGVGLFVLLVVPFLNDVLEWASGNVADFPDVSVIGRAFVAFIAGAFISLLSWLQNFGEDTGHIPTMLKETEASRTLRTHVGEHGAISTGLAIVIALLAMILVVLIVRG